MKSILLILFTMIACNAMAQLQWTKYPANPVITHGPSFHDAIAIGQPSVLFENDTFKMWYAAVGADMKGRICYAWSLDGISWTKLDSAVIDVGSSDTWDRGWMDTPEIVRDHDGYTLMYYGDTIQHFAAISSAMGVAYSNDGIHWTKEPSNPVFTKGAFGQWDGTWVESPAFYFDSTANEIYMWYNGIDTATWKIQIGLATSTDGATWVRYPVNPVLQVGGWGSYDDMWLGTPALIRFENKFLMFYSGTSALSYNAVTEAFDTVSICLATSTDGISWTKHSLNPLFITQTSPYDTLTDALGPWAPDVVWHEPSGQFMMWYETAAGICLATAPLDHTFISEIESQKVVVYPDPVADVANVLNLPQAVYTIEIFDVSGRKLYEDRNFSDPALPLQFLRPGYYLMSISGEKLKCSVPFVKN